MPGRRPRRGLRRSRRPDFGLRAFGLHDFGQHDFSLRSSSQLHRFASPPAVRLAPGGVGPFAVRSRAAPP
ncbi:hypothetical protein GLE_3178 [Lysobacter enzymogenes]|uniref:Uncharacterized protein n=1 Tax=Lysobacter enzymogenes TaxID=69 RepID=A0A0S2DJ14_LYSEN|nr:hypothetical protein GLE_3178 [Lysobacter enzymogenes]